MNDKIRKQILAIRDTGSTNMFDKITVQRLAIERGYYELVSFLEDKTKAYIQFILTGESEKQYTEVSQNAAFVRKAYSLDDLIAGDKEAKQRSRYSVEKTIILDEEGYRHFADNLIADAQFITENIEKMFVDKNGIKHCLFIRKEGANGGILVESEGYSYARYAAYLTE